MVFYDMQDFGGLEEYAVTLSIELHKRGHAVSVLSTAWVSPENQYLHRLRDNGIGFVQIPKWISQPASNWQTKEKILDVITWLFSPVILILGLPLMVGQRKSFADALRSARNWFRGQVMNRVIGPDRRRPLTRIMLQLWKIVWRPDILHVQGYTSASSLMFVIDWAHSNNIRSVYEEHQTPDPQFNLWTDYQNTINKADVVVAVSEKSAEGLRELCGVTQPIMIQGPLVPDPVMTGWKSETGRIETDAIMLTTVARLGPLKGLPFLLDAFKKIREKHPATRLKVYGEGPLREMLLSHAAQLGLDGNEIFVGAFVDHKDLDRIMQATDIFVLPSILEGQPVSLVEAMSYGRPIVATTVGGIPELIEDGVNGLLCDPSDPDALAQKVCKMIEEPDLRSRLGDAARKSYELGPFQPSSVCDNFTSIYGKVLHPTAR